LIRSDSLKQLLSFPLGWLLLPTENNPATAETPRVMYEYVSHTLPSLVHLLYHQNFSHLSASSIMESISKEAGGRPDFCFVG
jgi:hypothetical protein